LDSATKTYILDGLKAKVKSHNLKSGEVILLYDKIDNKKTEISETVKDFFAVHSLMTYPAMFTITEINYNDAVNSMKYGLATKPNYTVIETEFSTSDQSQIVYNFLQLFDNPNFYSIDTKLYKEALDLNDFWECGGAIVIDKNAIGILWTNDLYDKFH
jgi:hypothetical protein